MHVGDLDIVVCVWVDVGVHARLRLERLEIVRVRLEHILDKTLHRICKIDCHFSSPFLSISALPRLSVRAECISMALRNR